MFITVTGHRPDKFIGGWKAYENGGKGGKVFIPFLRSYLSGLGVKKVRLGCATGFDTVVARACIQENIRYDAYVPFEGFDKKWKQPERDELQRVLSHAEDIYIPDHIPTEYWEMAKMLNQRNEDMIDDSINCVVALWNGSDGGTKNCLKYARKHNITENSVESPCLLSSY